MVLAMAMTACVKEDSFKELTPGEFAFSVGSATTKAAASDEALPTRSFKLGDSKCYLEESISSLDEVAVSTKGTPIYTENIQKYYTTINAIGYNGSAIAAPDASFDFSGASSDSKKIYSHAYDESFWPDETTKLYFFLRAPADYIDANTKDNDASTLAYNSENGAISFTYVSPTDGKDQKDILFTSSTFSKQEYYKSPNYNSQGGVPVTFYHALTGVKFRNAHLNNGSTKTIIKSVKFKGLKSKGFCTVTPSATGGITSKYKVEWDHLDNSATFTMGFNNPSYFIVDDNGDPILDDNNKKQINPDDGTLSYGSDSQFSGTSLADAAADHNLNDDDASMTFWFIPQQIDESVTLEVTFVVKTPDTPNGTDCTHIIEFGKALTTTTGEGDDAQKVFTEWQPGQLRTYTLKPFDVDVEIFDEMADLTKDNLHVTNTGNVDEYVRIMVIGNWYGWKSAQDKAANPNNPMILVGYTSADSNDDTMVEPWYRENPVYAAGFDSTFPGGRPLPTSHWKRGTGSYFYYDQVIGAGQQLSGTDALFQHYELDPAMIPAIYLPVANQTTRQAAVGVHLVMEVVVQAIPTTKPDGTEFATCWEAWSYAVGKEIKAK